MSQAHAFPPQPIAPWAQVVPDAPPHITMGEFLDYPGEDGFRYELVEGVLVRMVGTRPRAGRINRRLYDQLAPFVRAHGLGTVTQPDEVYDFEHTGQKQAGDLELRRHARRRRYCPWLQLSPHGLVRVANQSPPACRGAFAVIATSLLPVRTCSVRRRGQRARPTGLYCAAATWLMLSRHDHFTKYGHSAGFLTPWQALLHRRSSSTCLLHNPGSR